MNQPIALTPAVDLCGESPRWDRKAAQMVWIDATRGHIKRWSADGEHPDITVGASISALAAAEDGHWIVGSERGLSLLSPQGVFTPIELPSTLGPVAVNELGVAPDGALLVGTAHLDGVVCTKPGRLLRVAGPNNVCELDEGFGLTNGIGLSPDGQTCYVTDSLARTIYAYDFLLPDRLTRKRVLIRFAAEDGLPDGLAVDAEGFVWSALWYGGKVVRVDPDGHIADEVALPCSQVSSLAFGGNQLDSLFITTAKEPWPSPYAPPNFRPNVEHAGALFVCKPGMQGTPVPTVLGFSNKAAQ